MLEAVASDSMCWSMELNHVLEVVASDIVVLRELVREVVASAAYARG